jgi:glutamate carboxypeptidase
MKARDGAIVAWAQGQQERLLGQVTSWADISSHSLDPSGLTRMADALVHAFDTLGEVRRTPVPPRIWIDDKGRAIEQPLGDVLSVRHVAPRERLRVLLAIHYDTVYPAGDQPPHLELVDQGRVLRGPGVADAKGGIAVLLGALEAAMHYGAGDTLSWEVLLNADEELGSPGSAGLLLEAATRHDLGLVFEPAVDEAGTLASSRKGSGNFHVVIHGKAAHAGRNPAAGRNAVVAAADLAITLANLNDEAREVTVNVAAIHGGDALNVVPDVAVVRVNVRAARDDGASWVTRQLEAAVESLNHREGYSATLHGGIHCPPKLFDEPTQRLFSHVATCGRDLGLTITAKPTGGVCDGNKLAAAGLPTIDTLGVRGGSIHSPDEYLLVESLTERASLVAILLARLADGSLDWPRRGQDRPPCS